ncbi:MAG TPA: hypothetical protein VIN75_27000 [Burkholderiaceae bacterium]
MAFKKTMTLVALGASLVAAGAAFAGPEAGHPNIIAAREHAQMAIEKMKAAQAANEYDMGGHAARAEKLLHEAEEQMRLAAEAANKHK